MKKRILALLVLLLLLTSTCSAEQMDGYQEDYFLQQLKEEYPLEGLILQTIKTDLAHLSIDQLDIAVTKMSADCKSTITEVVVTLRDETAELKE